MAQIAAENVQVRRESWGLLFYSAVRHKVCFVRSGEWLQPGYFDGSWTVETMVIDIARATRNPIEVVERSIQNALKHLSDNGMIATLR